jgi:hypothetical protein
MKYSVLINVTTTRHRYPSISSNVSLQSVESNSSTKSVPVHKWGIHFNDHTDLIIFLEQVDDLIIALNVSAVDLFEGPALTWFRSIRDNVTIMMINYGMTLKAENKERMSLSLFMSLK